MKTKLIILIATAVLLTGCSAFKTSRESKTTKQTETTAFKKDSSNVVEVSKPIKDRVVINVPKSDNEAVHKEMVEILKQLNTSKTSGSNSYVSRYDAETNRLIVEYLIGQTQNQQTTTTTDSQSIKSFEQQTDEYVKKKVKAIPWWVYAVAVFFFRKPIFGFLVELFPQLKTVKWLVRLIT